MFILVTKRALEKTKSLFSPYYLYLCMPARTISISASLIRSIAMGTLLSMLFTYLVHVFGEWKVENYRPDSQTTGSVILYNKCAVFGKTHILRPNTDVPSMDKGINGTKLSGSFMTFFDGHIVAMIVLSLTFGLAVFAVQTMKRKS